MSAVCIPLHYSLSAELYGYLQAKLEGNKQVILPSRNREHYVFRLSFDAKKATHTRWDETTQEIEFDEISVSSPPPPLSSAPYETALIHKGRIVYANSIGYEDIRSFYRMEDVFAEIMRVSDL